MSDTLVEPELLPFTPGRLPEISEAERQRPIWEVLIEQAQQHPEEELARIPHDAAEHHDHYLPHFAQEGFVTLFRRPA